MDFKDGQEPDNKRIEEQFMYKYMQMRPERVQQAKKDKLEEANTGVDDSEEDPELEKFADAEMEAQMRRMASGAPGGMPESDSEDVEGLDEALGDDGESVEKGSDDGFFSGEDDLEAVEVSGDDDEGEDMMSDGDSYGEE